MNDLGSWPWDPFAFKRWSKFDPRRIAFVTWSRFQELRSRSLFERVAIPLTSEPNAGNAAACEQTDTAVTKEQAASLISALRNTEQLLNPIVEIGCYRGVTTQLLASNTVRNVIGVDPFAGYGGAQQDYEKFRERTRHLTNVIHLRCTSGEAARKMAQSQFSFVFIDAVHDYVNTRFDSLAWGSLLRPNGVIAFHDTDDRAFAGTRRAVFDLIQTPSFELEMHVRNLVVLRKSFWI
jgi:predicted O-methyltransferase YrrM